MIAVLSLALLLICQLAAARPASEQEGAMADAIKYLAELDSFYSEQVRPRFGKRGVDDMRSLQNLERFLNAYYRKA
ncbi:neuropeptide F isoform X3 [Eurytemora carolleeae]|uniref:neuropeptide F isoform X3 n=1 Tax=Eurytemora carolleeae TaxID=1294199 RepID=UPI000C78360D|nr:neuropeptide F isoform X3 [Eurytemora carolleeae]|eukprot:XP_023345016.1 neuropeptide F-like isoform X3 [Eurytemora affinis]